MAAKNMTLRLSDEQAAAIELVARIDEQSVSDAIRAAIDAHIDARRGDVAFRERLRKRHAAEAALYDKLAE